MKRWQRSNSSKPFISFEYKNVPVVLLFPQTSDLMEIFFFLIICVRLYYFTLGDKCIFVKKKLSFWATEMILIHWPANNVRHFEVFNNQFLRFQSTLSKTVFPHLSSYWMFHPTQRTVVQLTSPREKLISEAPSNRRLRQNDLKQTNFSKIVITISSKQATSDSATTYFWAPYDPFPNA